MTNVQKVRTHPTTIAFRTSLVIQYFPVRSEVDGGRSRGTDRRLVRESLGVRVRPQSLTTSATREMGTTVISH